MEKERKLYNKFVDKLTNLLDNPDITPKEMSIILDFLKANNIQATEENKGVKDLLDKLDDLPFDVDELPIERFR